MHSAGLTDRRGQKGACGLSIQRQSSIGWLRVGMNQWRQRCGSRWISNRHGRPQEQSSMPSLVVFARGPAPIPVAYPGTHGISTWPAVGTPQRAISLLGRRDIRTLKYLMQQAAAHLRSIKHSTTSNMAHIHEPQGSTYRSHSNFTRTRQAVRVRILDSSCVLTELMRCRMPRSR
jgi:hypothetical protein